MNHLQVSSLILGLGSLVQGSEQPWQSLSDPSAAEVAEAFASPPAEYSMSFYWGWEGPVTREVITRDLDDYQARNVMAVSIEAGSRMNDPYLSDEWFELIEFAVEEAKKRGMRVWLVDEGKYPSGFAGGKFSEERPDLRMQTFRVGDPISVAGGESIDQEVPENTICAVASDRDSDSRLVIEPDSGRLAWTAPEGQWEVHVIEQQYRTSPTRSANNPRGGKDRTHSLCDYLDPEAVEQFIAWTHERYKATVGDEFGSTVLGFRGDEPDYGSTPWTDDLFAEFQEQKGYDVRPYLPSMKAEGDPTEAERRARADYWDVWSARFEESFFGQQGEWCEENNLEYLVHLNHEHDLMDLAKSEGDFFRCMRPVQMPGIDAIWDQIWPGKVSDYPKLASSAAHLFGRPRSFTESFAAYRPAPDAEQAEWILNQQLVRGINMVEVMWISASTRGRSGVRGWLADERFPAIAKYIHRMGYALSQGRPTAKIALYQPTLSLWLGDGQAEGRMLEVTRQLLEGQRDLDFVDDRSIASLLTLEDGKLTNLSGNGYEAVLVPQVTAISKSALTRLKEFSAAGGTVVFLGDKPTMVVDKTFLDAGEPGNLDWALHEASGELSDAVLEALPDPDLVLTEPSPSIKYLHRRLSDADLYFLFNESDEEQACELTLEGSGDLRVLDGFSGEISSVDSTAEGDSHRKVSLTFPPHQTRLLVVGGSPSEEP